MKRFLLALSLFLTAQTAFAGAELGAFSDIVLTHPNNTAIAWLKQQGIVSGYPDGTFHPDATINRAEFTKIVVRSKFSDAEINDASHQTQGISFPDAPAGQWYSTYISFASAKGIISGYPDGSFGPGRPINYAEAAKIVVKTYGINVAPAGSEDPWYLPFVNAVIERNAQPPTVRSFDQLLSRGGMAELVYRLRSNNPSATTSSILPTTSDEVKGQYLPYSDGVIGNGRRGILFFYASWCPYCKADEYRLQNWYRDMSFRLNTYKIDYDTATALKARFDVTTQDTFILVDEHGNAIDRVTFPSESMLKELLNR